MLLQLNTAPYLLMKYVYQIDIWGGIHPSSIFLYTFRVIFFKMYIHVSSDRLQTYFPSYPCPFERTNYCSFQIYTIEYHPIPASELIIAQGGGEVSLFSIFFSDLMSDVFCIDITPLVLQKIIRKYNSPDEKNSGQNITISVWT